MIEVHTIVIDDKSETWCAVFPTYDEAKLYLIDILEGFAVKEIDIELRMMTIDELIDLIYSNESGYFRETYAIYQTHELEVCNG